jgi:hypothetical protein
MPGRAGPRPRARSTDVGVEPDSGSGAVAGRGMMGGARPSAAAGGRAALLGRAGLPAGQAAERRGLRRPDDGVEGPPPDFGCWAAQKQGRREKEVFLFKKNNQTNEFKHNFQFKQSKTMHQHVCNNKLLYFII